jgi:hypothetical protein
MGMPGASLWAPRLFPQRAQRVSYFVENPLGVFGVALIGKSFGSPKNEGPSGLAHIYVNRLEFLRGTSTSNAAKAQAHKGGAKLFF